MKEKNAGEKLHDAIFYIQKEFHTTKRGIAEKMGVSSDMLYKYLKMDEFSDKVLFRLAPLEEFGINPKYFEDDDAEMLLEEKSQSTHHQEVESLKNTIYLQQELIEALREQNETLKENSLLWQQLFDKAGKKS